MKKKFCITEPVFGIALNIYLGYSAEFVKKILDANMGIDSDFCPREDDLALYWWHISKKQTVKVIWVREFKYDATGIAMLTHEISHAINDTLLKKGIPLSKDTGEVYAYMTEWALYQCLKIIKKQ